MKRIYLVIITYSTGIKDSFKFNTRTDALLFIRKSKLIDDNCNLNSVNYDLKEIVL